MHLLSNPFILFAFAMLVLIIVSSILKTHRSESAKERELPYVKKQYLMTPAEREFYKVLHSAVGNKYYIVPQVQLYKIVQVEKGKWEYKYKNWINLKSVDFVLFDNEYFTPQVVIELDDSSHTREDRKERDSFVDAVMHKVGMRIVHIKNSSSYDKEILNSVLYKI